MADSKLPFSITAMSEDEMASRRERGILKCVNSLRVSPGDVLMPPSYIKLASTLYNFPFGGDDVLVTSVPKSGSTWVREILWGLLNINNLHLADQHLLHSRTYSLTLGMTEENWGVIQQEMIRRVRDECGIEAKTMQPDFIIRLATAHKGSPRIMYATMPLSLFNPNLIDNCKVVYVARNPKDLCVSSYNFYSSSGRYSGDFDTYAQLFMDGHLIPGSYWQHIKQAWQLRNHPNFCFLFYEDLKTDFPKELAKLSHFLGLNLTQQQLDRVAEHASYKRMKSREDKLPIICLQDGTSFFKGANVGLWPSLASKHIDNKMNQWIQHNSKDFDKNFRYS